MQKCGFHTFKHWGFLALFASVSLLSSCDKLKDNSPHASIFPSNGSNGVPVNAIVEIHYPAELELSIDQMKKSVFSIHECENDTFAYFNPQNMKDPTKPESPTEKTNTEQPKEDEKKEASDKPVEQSPQQQTKYKSSIKFFHTAITDESKRIFNYLVIDPEGRESPLKPATTYCVLTKELKNAKGEKIRQKEISFTTEDSAVFAFDSQVSAEFLGNRMAPTLKDKEGKFHRDYVLLNFRNQAVDPSELRKQIKVCMETTTPDTASSACKGYGKEVASDVFLIEGFQQNTDGVTTSSYNLYGVSPRLILKAGERYKVVLDLDIDKNQDSIVGSDEAEFEIDSSSELNWKQVYQNDVMDEDGKSRYSPIGQPILVGAGS